MPATKGRSGNALGLTGKKARSSTAVHSKGKPALKVEHDAKPALAAKRTEPTEPTRSYPKALLAEAEGRPHLDIESPKYDALWADAQERMGRKPSVNRIEHILRIFDLNATYGPCTGMTRLERWQRAHDIGEEPPVELREILQTREGILDLRLSILDQVMEQDD